MATLRILIVDDSVVFRSILAKVIGELNGARVSGFATNGKEALEKIELLKPDMVSLDIEMPELNGIQTLKEIQKRFNTTKVVMVSSLTKKGAQSTIECLENGALDFITKPDSGNAEENHVFLKDQLQPIVDFFTSPAIAINPVEKKANPQSISNAFPKVICVGSSTGGPKALEEFLEPFQSDFPIPIVIVQHMPKLFTTSLAKTLDSRSNLKVCEAIDGQKIEKGNVYIAPGGLQMKLQQDENKFIISIRDDPPEKFCKPSVDYLFRSVSQVFKEHAYGVILTGMGSDGTKGLKLLKRHGCKTFGQDEASSTVYGMPREAWLSGVIDQQLPPKEIAQEIINNIKKF